MERTYGRGDIEDFERGSVRAQRLAIVDIEEECLRCPCHQGVCQESKCHTKVMSEQKLL